MASVSLFALNASSGYLSLAANAGTRPNGRLPRPTSATTPAPCRISRRVAGKPLWVVLIEILLEAACRSQCLQEIHHRVDLLLGQDPVSSERRHHGLRIAFGFVRHDGDEVVAIGVLALDVLQCGPDGAGKIAALDVVAGQAIALAAVERDFLAFGNAGLR